MENKETVQVYYQKVDERDLDWVVSILAENACYRRADAVYSGREAIDNFYRNDRKIIGKHTLNGLLSIEEQVIAFGEFNGVGAQGQEKKLSFVIFGHSKEIKLWAGTRTFP